MTDVQNSLTDIPVHINLLGGFYLQAGDKVVSDKLNRTRQLWNLLEYLIAYRHKSISQEELISALWPNDNSGNPANALKNLIYRIRTLFASHDIPLAKDMLIFRMGSYCWNNQLNCIIDTEEFERLANAAICDDLPFKTRLDYYMEAIDLYKGDFLPNSSYEEWVIPLANFYRSLYFKCVYGAINLLTPVKRYDQIQSICEKAVLIDPYEEAAHRHLINALVAQNRQNAALHHYQYVTDLFYRELGVKPSEEMRRLYRDIAKTVNNVENDLNVIKEDLSEQNLARGAFSCGYEVFKNIYRIEARSACRTGQSICIGLVTVTDVNDAIPELPALNKAMDQLSESLRLNLRKGDIISRFSATQYVLMLPTVTLENGERVMNRVCGKFRAKNIKLHWKLQPLDPVM